MTTHQAKKDAKAKLQAAGVAFAKLTAKTLDFTDLARAKPVFVYVHGIDQQAAATVQQLKQQVPKPSEGGYILSIA